MGGAFREAYRLQRCLGGQTRAVSDAPAIFNEHIIFGHLLLTWLRCKFFQKPPDRTKWVVPRYPKGLSEKRHSSKTLQPPLLTLAASTLLKVRDCLRFSTIKPRDISKEYHGSIADLLTTSCLILVTTWPTKWICKPKLLGAGCMCCHGHLLYA